MWPCGRILQLATALGTWSPVMHQRAKHSRTTASEEDALPAKRKHRIGYNLDWRATFSWHVLVQRKVIPRVT